MKSSRLFLILALSLSGGAHAAEGVQGDLAFVTGRYAEAYADWSKAAADGDASAMAGVGLLYDTGHGVPQNFTAALSWYERSAQAGFVPAMFDTAAMYDNGRGTPVNRPQAVYWYRMAAAHGNGRAAYDLGLIYRDGDGVPQAKSLAIRYFRIAAAAGIVAARSNLAALGAGPVVAPKAPSTLSASVTASRLPTPPANQQADAISHFQSAALARVEPDGVSAQSFSAVLPSLDQQARSGSGYAQYDLAFAYERGFGVAADPVQSYTYYLKAATSREAAVNAAALKGAAEVGKQLTPEQHAAARQALLEGE